MTRTNESREYELAVLQALEDGQPHSREELMRVGIAAIDPHYALAMYQKSQKGKAEAAAFEGMTSAERFSEIERQRFEGAKLQVSKNLSHIVDRHLAEVAEYGPTKVAGRRGPVLSLRITDRGRERARGASDEDLDANWQAEARESLRKLAEERPFFTSEDLWEAGVPRLENKHAVAVIFTWGKRQGMIQATDRMQKASRGESHGRPMQVWKSLICDQDAPAKVSCLDCGNPADPLEPGSAYEVRGFIAVRASSGGANQILFPEELGNVLCPSCVKARRPRSNKNRRRRKRPRLDEADDMHVSLGSDESEHHPDILV